MNKFIPGLLLPALLSLALSPAAAAGRDEGRGEGRQEEPELRPVTLMLDWVPNVNHVGIFATQEKGFFEDAGLDVSIIQPGEVRANAAVAGGKADFGIDFQENLTLLRAQEIPLVSIAAVFQTNTSGFAVRKGEGIDDPSDFAGLKYGTFQSPFEEPTLYTLVRCMGGEPDTIDFVPAGTDLLAMLQQKQADIVWIFYGTQGFQAQRLGIDIEYFPLNRYAGCIPDYYTPIVITSEETIKNRPDLVRDFLSALSRGHAFAMQHPEEAAELLAAAVPELNARELRQSVPWLADYMHMDAPAWGYQERSVWEDYAHWMMEVGVLKEAIDVSKAFTNEFLDTAQTE